MLYALSLSSQPIMLSTPPDAPSARNSTDPLNEFLHSILSYDTNIMLAAIISLLVVILFVLLLHAYAKWFLLPARQRSRRSVSSVPQVFGVSLNHHLQQYSFAMDHTTFATSHTKGLESSAISWIPLFVYKTCNEERRGLNECAICLGVFEDEELCRRLPVCSHEFHVQCIDMWLDSHSTCPICRSCLAPFDVGSMDQGISDTILDEAGLFNDNENSRSSEMIVVEVQNAVNIDNIAST